MYSHLQILPLIITKTNITWYQILSIKFSFENYNFQKKVKINIILYVIFMYNIHMQENIKY